ncbi:hypothetical protein CVT24_012934 [Panaeolus cyanescens]|uniref:Uncharacterized protein n=1 Tax=Panaeolus cyanescens TaxID=181874 RepID=A0A409W6L8_9AGAR|nr:hypothetical protein CVT24_012934 [Panaeolus cyanescens]
MSWLPSQSHLVSPASVHSAAELLAPNLDLIGTVHPTKKSLEIFKTKTTSSYLGRSSHITRSERLLMSLRLRRVKQKLASRPLNVTKISGLSSTPSLLQHTEQTSEAVLVHPDSETLSVSSPTSTTATLVESFETPNMPKEASDCPARSDVLPSVQRDLPSEEPPIAISMPAPINASALDDPHAIPRPSSQSPPPLPRINTGVFTPKGSFKVRISDRSYCKWHKMVFQHRTHPDEKMAYYFKHIHESEEELLEIQRIASLGPIPKEWNPKYQQMNMPGFSDLPVELTDQIFEHLFQPNTKPDKLILATLSRCNVAFNAWTTPHLFREVNICIKGDSGRRLALFREILDGRPAIATVVQSFTLQVFVPSTSDYNPIYKDTNLPVFLPQLQNITQFNLHVGSLPKYSALDWDRLSGGWSQALQNVCLLPSVTSVQLCNVCFLKSGWITHCKSLQDFGIWNTLDSFGDAQGSHVFNKDPTSIPNLKRLRLDKINAPISTIYELGGFSALEKIEVALAREQFVGTVRGIIEGASDTLEDLSVHRFNEAGSYNHLRYDFPSWTPLPALKKLTLGVNASPMAISDQISHWSQYANWILRNLPPSCPVLDKITLVASPMLSYFGPPHIYTPSTEHWSILEQTCATRYPALRKLVFVFQETSVPDNWVFENEDIPQGGSSRKEKEESVVSERLDVSEKFSITSLIVLLGLEKAPSHHSWNREIEADIR